MMRHDELIERLDWLRKYTHISIASTAADAIAALRELQAERDALKAELDSVLSDWNALVRAIGSPTNGGAVGHAAALKAENERLKSDLIAARNLEHIARIELAEHRKAITGKEAG